jgi:hypothetical protein
MTEIHLNPANGVFEPPVLEAMAEAFDKAERQLDRLRSSVVPEIDRDRVARRIVSEARAGETQPDLVSRAAVAKVLLEVRAKSSTDGTQSGARPWARPLGMGQRKPADLAVIPPAGPHATPRQSNADTTPGSGVLPCEQPGDDVDPGAG